MTSCEQTPVMNLLEAVSDDERRRETRYAIPGGVRLEMRAIDTPESIQAEVINISRNGFGLMANGYLAPNSSVAFQFGLKRIYASVRFCRQAATGFEVGLLIGAVLEDRSAAGAVLVA